MAKKRKTPRKKKKPSQRRPVVGVAWYLPAEWQKMRGVASDAELLESSHQEWLEMAESSLEGLREAGLYPVKIYLDIEELVAWCGLERREVDGAARAAFASYKLREKVESS